MESLPLRRRLLPMIGVCLLAGQLISIIHEADLAQHQAGDTICTLCVATAGFSAAIAAATPLPPSPGGEFSLLYGASRAAATPGSLSFLARAPPIT